MDARNFTFQFNLCQNTFSKVRRGSAAHVDLRSVSRPAPPPQPSQSCNANLNAPAWQHDRNTDSCYALGGDLSGRVSQQALSIHDPRRPAAGFNLRYWGGQKDFCSENGESFSRSFTLAFMCEPTMTFPSPGPLPHEEFVRETSPCVYEAYSFSQSGCPTQCPVYDGKVCGGRGVCRYDTDAVQARCFCNDGYISDNGCKPVTVPSPAGGIAGGFFGGLALGGLGVAIWWFLTQRNQTPAGAEDYAYSGNLQ